jgi:hypothetical protein
MPHRSDKRDFLALMALVSDLNIEFVDGVNGSLIHPSAIPAVSRCKRTFRYNGFLTLRRFGTTMLPPECGDVGARISISISSQYSFLPIFAYLTECSMVQNRIHSALIIEDDSDWDILLKPQMLSFARGVQILQDSVLPLHSPYGDSWNVITLGHIGANNKPNRLQKYYVTHNDPTVIPAGRRAWERKPDFSAEQLQGNYSQMVMEVNRFTGTGAYAVSLRGAARLLYDQSMSRNARAIDPAIANVCRHDDY